MAIPSLLEQVGAQGILDVGCGDFNWMSEVVLPCDYLGIDIVCDVIAENQVKHSRDGVSFSCLNAVKDELPKGFDVILCREVLFHLSFRDCLRVLQNFVASGSKYLLVTSSTDVRVNRDTVSGGFRNLNLQEAPFNFTEPDLVIDDDSVSSGRVLGLWRVSDLVRADAAGLRSIPGISFAPNEDAT